MAKDSISEQCIIKLGPWGGPGGREWSCKLDCGLSGIGIRHGDCIDSVAFGSGDAATDQMFGGNGGSLTKVNINWPTEYLTNICGTCETWYPNGTDTIRSLCFYTNLNKYGPFGVESGYAFNIPIKCGVVIAGFHGRVDTYLHAIGVHVVPKSLFSQPSQ